MISTSKFCKVLEDGDIPQENITDFVISTFESVDITPTEFDDFLINYKKLKMKSFSNNIYFVLFKCGVSSYQSTHSKIAYLARFRKGFYV